MIDIPFLKGLDPLAIVSREGSSHTIIRWNIPPGIQGVSGVLRFTIHEKNVGVFDYSLQVLFPGLQVDAEMSVIGFCCRAKFLRFLVSFFNRFPYSVGMAFKRRFVLFCLHKRIPLNKMVDHCERFNKMSPMEELSSSLARARRSCSSEEIEQWFVRNDRRNV